MNRRVRLCICLLGLCLPILGSARLLAQYTPSHPKVQAMVDQGVKFLNSSQPSPRGGFGLGSRALVGYALLKATGDPDLPNVKQGVQAAQQLARSLASFRETGESKIIYEVSVAAVLLASVDMAKYQPELVTIREWLLEVQKPHGGFGYLEKPTGDTSQVQYVMLAFWTMAQAGMDIPDEPVERCINYIRSTMDPSGTWGYQGVIGSGGRLVRQENVSKSLGTAGVGALIIGADILQLFGARKTPEDEAEGIPDALKRVDLLLARRAKGKTSLKKDDVEPMINRARQYQNNSQFSGAVWYYYWRYSQERYESFHEIVQGKQEKSPAWYNQGVEELAKAQDEKGSWGSTGRRDFYPADVCTAFSILFLIRSTQKSIGTLDEGLAFGGYGLPSDLSNIKMVGGKIVSDEEQSVENLLAMLEGDEVSGVEISLLPKNLKLHEDPKQRKEQVARLSRLLVSQDALARRKAAQLLGRSDDLNVVPDLVFALTDPDSQVPMLAEESLRLISRKLTVGELGLDPDSEARAKAIKFWKTWYLGLRPDYIFVER